MSDLRFLRNLLPDAQHYIWDENNVETTPYIWTLRGACFSDPLHVGVYHPKPAPFVKKAPILAPFNVESADFTFPNKEEATCNPHLFDVYGNTVCRIVGEDSQLMWTEDCCEYEINYGNVAQRSFSSVLCHRKNNWAIAIGQDRCVYLLEQDTGQLLCKSEKMFQSLFETPLVSWLWPSCPSLLSLAVGCSLKFYDFMVEETVMQVSTRRHKKINRVAPCAKETDFLLAVHYQNSAVDIFDVRKPNLALNSLDRSTIAVNWQPKSRKLSLLNDCGKIEALCIQTGFVEPVFGLPESRDTTGLFWVNQDELYLTSSKENGLDCIDYWSRTRQGCFANKLHWSTEEDLLCARLDCNSRCIYASVSDCKIYGFPLPNKPQPPREFFPLHDSALVSRQR